MILTAALCFTKRDPNNSVDLVTRRILRLLGECPDPQIPAERLPAPDQRRYFEVLTDVAFVREWLFRAGWIRPVVRGTRSSRFVWVGLPRDAIRLPPQ